MATRAAGMNSTRALFRPLENQIQEFRNIVVHRLDFFRAIALRHLRNHADAEDAVQDALLSAYAHLDQFKGQAQMSTWLTTIVTNCARMRLRRRPRLSNLSLDERFGEQQEYALSEILADRGPSPEDECHTSELRGRLLRFAEQLSPRLRKTFQLRDLDGLSINEAAHILGLPHGTVKAQLARARAKLRRLMGRRSMRTAS